MHYKPADIARVWAGKPHLLWLDSADETHADTLWSYVLAEPDEWIEGSLEECTPRIRAALLQRGHNNHYAPAVPFAGGVAGYFGYDGTVAVGVYSKVFAYDYAGKHGVFIGCEAPPAELLSSLRSPTNSSSPQWGEAGLTFQPKLSASLYQSRVQKVINYILAGDIFQANLSQGFEADLPANFNALDYYLGLRERNPAPFGGYFDAGKVSIASCSPERFLSINNTGRIETKPIKGTAPRSSDKTIDKDSASALITSEKDRAENIMIVDLLRNDLSKVCKATSVQVEKLCALESFARVHHLVSTVSGQLEKGKDALDALSACFPGGSITGAPKIRAMEIIAELEDTPRGPYTGALGWIGFDGAMDSNILIRSVIFENGIARLNVGGGITARSNPEAEYQETLDKASGMIGR